MESVLDRLKAGVRTFQSEIYPLHEESYLQAVQNPQRPHTLMITCADSRIDIETVTHARPGELFTARNVGNIVPGYGEVLGGVSAVIEYAVSALKVSHVVICGHSDCGAMKALQDPETLEALPTVKGWLHHAHAAVDVAQNTGTAAESSSVYLQRLTERNVLLQMQHLKTHPSVAVAMARGELTISGWVYEIGSGRVRIAEDGEQAFTPVETAG